MRNASPARESSAAAGEHATECPARPTPWRVLYGVYAWLQFLLIGLSTLALLLCLPTLRLRRTLTRAASRLALVLAGMRVRASGLEDLPAPCVVVANHASYLDGVLLNALMPTRFSFVIKREMSSVPLAGLLLRRLGAEFVDRSERARRLGDARRLLRRASSGQSLVFFPEGTFGPVAGLLHFHIGAFAAAARANLPVVPVAIRGTRHCLPPGSLWPRPGRIDVRALPTLPALPSTATPSGPSEPPALASAGTTAAAAIDTGDRAAFLRDHARAAVLAALGEPDLARGAAAPRQVAGATTPPTLREEYARSLGSGGYRPDEAQSAAVDALEAMRARLLHAEAVGLLERLRRRWRGAAGPPVRGLYLWGPVGRGKTWLMDLFFNSVPLRNKRRSHFHHFMRDVHALLGQLRGRTDPLALVAGRVAAGVRLLCLDELFVSDIADAMILGQLFEALLARGVALVITSNVPPGDLYRGGLQRSRFLPAIALLERELDVVAVDGGVDYRLRQLQHRPLYFDSRAEHTRAQMRELMRAVAAEHGDATTALTLSGRKLRAIERRGDVIWFDFATLCEGPRHANDYADLAQEFHTVLLSDVPVFAAYQQDNAARRFIALVDELYDQGVKLVVSAAAPPHQLYRAEALEFEFQRASSRLTEMQSEAYLARAHRRHAEPLGATGSE